MLANILIVLLLIVVISITGIAIVSSLKDDAKCNAVCYPDPFLNKGCYNDRVICVGKDRTYVKGF